MGEKRKKKKKKEKKTPLVSSGLYLFWLPVIFLALPKYKRSNVCCTREREVENAGK